MRFLSRLLISLSCLCLPLSAAWAEAASKPSLVLVGLDLSRSNPLVDDKAYAARAGQRVADEIQDLQMKSRVMLRTFGSYDAGSNALKVDEIISARSKPGPVASGISALVGAVPQLVSEGKLSAQSTTNIVPFLESMSAVVDCNAYDVTIILLTDGFEDSEYARLARGGSLPKPAAAYAGCHRLMMLGVGQGGKSPSATRKLQAEWAGWAEAAGFENFTALHDW